MKMFNLLQDKIEQMPHEKRQLLTLGAWTGILKSFSAFSAFFLTLAISWYTTPEITGQFFFLFNLVFLLALLCQLGFHMTLVKYNAVAFEQGDSELQSANYQYASKYCLVAALVVSSVLIACSVPFYLHTIEVKLSFWATIAIALVVPLLTFGQLNSRVLQVIKHVTASLVALQLGVNLLLIGAIYLLHWYGVLSLESLIYILMFSAALVAAQSYVSWCRSGCYQSQNGAQPSAGIGHASKEVWIGSLLTNLVQWGGLVICGFFLSNEALGLLATATRASQLIGFILITTNFVLAPMFASLYKQGHIERLKRLSHFAFRINLSIALPPVLLCTVFPEWAMGIFGEEYRQGAALLVWLALGQLINVATGSVAFLLLMSGFETTMKHITVSCGIVALLLLVVLTPLYGAVGAAAALGIGMAILNIVTLFFVKRRLGFIPIG